MKHRLRACIAATAAFFVSGAAVAAASAVPAGKPIDGERIAQLSAGFIGRPYQLDPLGEGVSGDIDSDPLWRSDAFDCLTFVETVMALARSSDSDSAQRDLQRIRYADGRIGFASRNHFPDADWIPNNVRSGIVEDVTQRIADSSGLHGRLALAKGVIHRSDWLRALPRNPLQARNPLLTAADGKARLALLQLAETAADQPIELPYLYLKDATPRELQRLLSVLPNGAVVFIVRPNTSLLGRVGAVTQISHVGFALRTAAAVVVYRNASSGRVRRVVDQPFLGYLRRLQSTRSFAGVVVLQALRPPIGEQMP